MIDILAYIEISDGISLSDIAITSVDTISTDILSDTTDLKADLHTIAFTKNSIEGRKSSDLYLLDFYNKVLGISNYNDANVTLLISMVSVLQKHVTAHYPGGVNSFLSDNGEKVMQEFADLSERAGYIIDPSNIV